MMQPKKLLVEQDPHQTRVALLEGQRVVEVYHEPRGGGGMRGQVFKGRVHRVLPGMQAAFIDIGLERDAFLHVEDVRPRSEAVADENATSPPTIDDLLKPGQELVVQVAKGPLANKGARVSAHVTLPGRYLVFVPGGDHRGISRRITDEEERERLRELLAEVDVPGGLIARTAGEECGLEELQADADSLLREWLRIESRASNSRAPELLHRDLGIALATVRDLFDESFSGIWVAGEELSSEIEAFSGSIEPGFAARVHQHVGDVSLFETHGVEEAIEAALRPRVWLKSGGYLVIQPTEALVAIDVNTGRNVGRRSLSETILQTNLEAVAETARQIRLRNLSGILVLDLIDMTVEEHRETVYAALEDALTRDRVRTQILSISEFGLVEMTRKRSRPSLHAWLTQECRHCRGRGRVHAASYVVDKLRRSLLERRPTGSTTSLGVTLHPSVVEVLRNERRAVIDELELQLGRSIELVADPLMSEERFTVEGDWGGDSGKHRGARSVTEGG